MDCRRFVPIEEKAERIQIVGTPIASQKTVY
jgi:hypothetical protein